MATRKRAAAEQLRQAIIERVNASRHPLPLGELYRAMPTRVTLGQFHDALRELNAAGVVRLSPWTGAMYQLEQPECCLILGREIIGYVVHARKPTDFP